MGFFVFLLNSVVSINRNIYNGGRIFYPDLSFITRLDCIFNSLFGLPVANLSTNMLKIKFKKFKNNQIKTKISTRQSKTKGKKYMISYDNKFY